MALTSCCFSDKKRGAHVKIVYPGGRVELYDHPILASEIMSQNPRSCVTSPDVFQRPWAAVVSPDTALPPGRKFYVVPMRTIRKLRRNSPMNSSSPYREDSNSHTLSSNLNTPKREEKRSRNGCFVLTLRTAKGRPEGIGRRTGEAMKIDKRRGEENLRKETRGSPRRWLRGSSETESSARQQPRESSPGTPSYHWQPSLTSIVEE